MDLVRRVTGRGRRGLQVVERVDCRIDWALAVLYGWDNLGEGSSSGPTRPAAARLDSRSDALSH